MVKVAKEKQAEKVSGKNAKDDSEANIILKEEATERLNVPLKTLSMIEKRFSCVAPSVGDDKKHYYDEKTFSILEKIVDMHYRQGFTFKGVQNFLDSEGIDCPPQQTKARSYRKKTKSQASKKVEKQGELHITPIEEEKLSLNDFIPRLENILSGVCSL